MEAMNQLERASSRYEQALWQGREGSQASPSATREASRGSRQEVSHALSRTFPLSSTSIRSIPGASMGHHDHGPAPEEPRSRRRRAPRWPGPGEPWARPAARRLGRRRKSRASATRCTCPAGKPLPPLAYQRIQARGETLKELRGACHVRGRNFLLAGIKSSRA